MNHIEVEIKALLGSRDAAETLLLKMKQAPTLARQKAASTQLNHYFVGGDVEKLLAVVSPKIREELRGKLEHILREGNNHSVRTRSFEDGRALLVVKASIDDTTSSNGVSRIEFEEPVPGLSLEDLDALLLECGFSYQAKWSREREEYELSDGTVVCLDKNAGYGYLAEFEKLVSDSSEAENAKSELRALMETLGVEELAQDRLERMFAFYNEHWPEYYGTDKIFVIE